MPRPHPVRIPAGELDGADQRQHDGEDAELRRQARHHEQRRLGRDHHREGERPDAGDDHVGAQEARAVPQRRRHLLARVLQGEGPAQRQRGEDDQQQAGIDGEPDGDHRPVRPQDKGDEGEGAEEDQRADFQQLRRAARQPVPQQQPGGGEGARDQAGGGAEEAVEQREGEEGGEGEEDGHGDHGPEQRN